MAKRNFKYGLKLVGRFAGGFEILTRDEVRLLFLVFKSLSDRFEEDNDFDLAVLFGRLASVFDLND